jgi:DNA recombination protein RmuC
VEAPLVAALLLAGVAIALALAAVARRPPGDGGQGIRDLAVELRGLGERVLAMEREQGRAAEAIRADLARAHQDLAALGAAAVAARDLDRRTAESIRRLEAVIAGSQTKGAAGEQILEAVFARLPPEWQVRNFRVGDKTVEFGLRLPNRLVLPIDSKWAATPLLDQLAAAEDGAERERLKTQIESAVLARAREVRKYLDPRVTASFGVAAVPDAVYDLCAGIHADAFQSNVVLVSYSLFVPYLLLVFQTTLRAERQVDLERLEAFLGSVERHLSAIEEELDGRFAKSITMLQNARADMGAHLAKVTSGLAGLGHHAGGGAVGTTEAERDRVI